MYYVYIAYQPLKKAYLVGVTNMLTRRMRLLRQMYAGPMYVVYYETYQSSTEADRRENQWLDYSAAQLQELVRKNNPHHLDILKP